MFTKKCNIQIFVILHITTGTIMSFNRTMAKETISLRAAVTAPTYSYDDTLANGPSNWGKLNPTCNGKRQSPIDIRASTISPGITFTPLSVTLWDELPINVRLQNVGSSVNIYFNYENGRIPTIKGGPLHNDVYVLSAVQFHWGTTCHTGSEHKINGVGYAVEMQAVFYNQNYDSVTSSLVRSDGLAIVSRLYECLNYEKTNYKFAQYLQEVINFNDEYEIATAQTFSIGSILGKFDFDYYSYKGSVTTPPCSEVVQWIVIDRPLKMSVSEINELRRLKNANAGSLGPNVRQGQLRNNRKIYYHIY